VSRLPSLGPRGEGWVAIQFVLFPVIALAGTVGPTWDGTPRIVTAIAGFMLMAVGAVLAGWGLLELRDALTPLPHPRDGADLVETGAYRLARHPIYGGIIIGAFGYGLATASPLALLGALVLLGFFRLKSAREEVWLVARYDAYPAYRTRTRRLIPFLY
jgi:protein-S-isoprenylcysteine O-methyltransferase Ste14